ncbi:hypothetical protein TNCV_4771411 [Trichonephila clavipes]|nr:hypothetical protein TNCV_4771411 [Trichonephila clavipes]
MFLADCLWPIEKLGKFVKSNVIHLRLNSATRGLLATDHVILNHGQVTWTTPELTPPSPNYHTTSTGRLSGLSSLVVNGLDLWLACHEFQSIIDEDPPCRGGQCPLNMSWLKSLPVGVVWKEDSLPDGQTGRVCKGYRDDSESHRNTRPQMQQLRGRVQRSRGERQKQQHINATVNILLKGCTTTGVRIYEQKLSGRTDSVAVWNYVCSWRMSYVPAATYIRAATEGVSSTKLFM